MATRTRSSSIPDEGRRILDAIRQLVRALRLFDREAQSKHGISAAQMFVMHALEGEDGLSLNELAERTATDQSSASVVVQRLVDAGYVSRTQRKDDRRHVELRVTPKGKSVTRRAKPPAQQKILAAVAAMSPRDRKSFATLLEAFVEDVGVDKGKAPMLFEEPPRRKR